MGRGPNISAAGVGHVQTNPRQGYFPLIIMIMIMIPSCQYNFFDHNKIYLQLEQKKKSTTWL